MTQTLSFLFLASVPLANWLISNVGEVCVSGGPCLIHVAPGIMAPSGVLVIGVALVLRDALQERAGPRWVALMILAGAAASTAVAPPALAAASAVAFFIGEFADFAVYCLARRFGRAVAVFVSGLAGAAADTALFSALAFGSIAWAPGLMLAKVYASAAFAVFLVLRRRLLLS